MSNDLQWLLLRKSNSYMVKAHHGPIFSKEPGNLLGLHSHKYSGLANSKTIDVTDVNGKITITTHKTKASPTAVSSARSTSTIRPRSGSRRALGIASTSAKRGYRPDLRKVSSMRM
ncbi:ribosomal L28e/Mak16, partial [Rhodocollybia butyracea]